MTTQLGTSNLAGVPETLLIPLAARLIAHRRNPDLHFADPAAEAVGKAIGFDPDRFSHDKASMRGCVARGQWFDRIVNDWLNDNPHGLVISIGSGLDTRANRLLPPPGVDWVDIDFPEVVSLREAYVPTLANVTSLAADGTDVPGWGNSIPWHHGRPVMMIAEGVSMYLQPQQALSWLRELSARAEERGSGLTVALDLASPLMVSQSHRHPSVSKTGAVFSWGVKRPVDLTTAVPGLRLIETYDIARQCGLPSLLVASAYRLLTLGRPIYSCAKFGNAKAHGSIRQR
ncbi:class I SAM-dependent methyltransferase [Novosphingobium sp. BL-8A]|uniref:class I SAM-dependent methyltransferase n=1 Tax=Novosphingobium sp. BL-8A TaxID=3127639 RepID=UPI003756856B